jgi:squalene-associated FAD-dependent desaturase
VSRSVVVVGGGLAGITAALACADAGAEVVLAERRSRLGGLTWSFQRRGLWLDNGQHVFLRCCTAYRALLDRLGVGALVHLQDRLDIPVVAPGGRSARLRRSHLPAPLHLAPSLLGYAHLPAGPRLALGRAALALRRLDPGDPALDARTFGAWLAGHGQGERAVDVLWDLITVPTVNLHAREASLALAVKVFRTGLLDRADAGDVGWSTVPLGRLHGEAAATALDRAGVEVWTGARVARVSAAAGGWEVVADGRTVAADAVIVATPPEVAAELVPDGVLGPVAELGASPIVNVHLVFDRRVTDLPMAAAVDSPVQFVFDRSESSGLRGPGQCLAVSLSAADAYLGWGAHALQAYIASALAELFPAAQQAEVVDAAVTREPRATFRGVPGTARLRPPAQTELPGLLLAGAWTATGWPATMEGAVRSGAAAARGALGGPSVPDLEPVTVLRGGTP